MINEDTFKSAIHIDEAFKALWEKEGSSAVMEQLMQMQMKLSTQLVQWGDEREGWYKRASGLLAVVKVRIDEVKSQDSLEAAEYKDLVQGILENVQDKFDKHDYPLPDVNDIDAVDAWLESVGL